jgi:hypothetical protein
MTGYSRPATALRTFDAYLSLIHFRQELMMRNALSIALAGLLIMSAVASAMAQTRGRAVQPRTTQGTYSPANPYGLSDCSQRPFARDCDRRGTW